MMTPDTAESIKFLKSMAATLGLLLVVSNVLWYIAYTTSTGPLARPTASPSLTPTATATAAPATSAPVIEASPSPAPVTNPPSPAH